MSTDTTITIKEIDCWRAGLLTGPRAAAVQQAVHSNPDLAVQAQFGARVVAGLSALPQLAAQLPQRPSNRSLRWPRIMAAGLATASVALFTLAALPSLSNRTVVPAQSALVNAKLNPQLADALQNMDFYEWLAAHPEALQDARHANNPA